MSGIDEYSIGEHQQQQHSTYSPIDTNAVALSIITMSEMNLTNLTIQNTTNRIYDLMSLVLNNTTLTYKISLGFICACLCLLTITGNLLVLITFRRIRTVSIRNIRNRNDNRKKTHIVLFQ